MPIHFTQIEGNMIEEGPSEAQQKIILFLDDSNASAGIAHRAETFERPFEVRYARGEVDGRPRAVRAVEGGVVNYFGAQAVGAMFSELTSHDRRE